MLRIESGAPAGHSELITRSVGKLDRGWPLLFILQPTEALLEEPGLGTGESVTVPQGRLNHGRWRMEKNKALENEGTGTLTL